VELRVNTDFKYLQITRYEDTTADGTADSVESCPHTIIVDDDYIEPSLTWFDAATLQGRDVIVLNERAHGHPVIIIYEDGVWSDPQPLLPLDIVDNYSFVRVAGLVAEEGQLLATGRIGRAGSTGLHAQAADVLFRGKFGDYGELHWTFDRYCYLCEANQRSKFVFVASGYAFYPGGATVKYDYQTYLLGGDPSSRNVTITDDILSWNYEQPSPGVACAGSLQLADHDGDYDSSLKPGDWLWRYAGYNSYSVLLSTEAIDLMQQGYQAGNRTLNLSSRDIAMRLMKDWACDQDWQWLSQQKHYDDCDLMDYLYSISGATITVRSEDDHEQTGEEDETEVEEENSELVFQVYNKPGVFLTTKPFDARNFHVKARFQYQNDDEALTGWGTWALDMDLTLEFPRVPHIGYGFGVVGCAVDKYNLIAAFVDLPGGKLRLLTRRGDEDDNSWTELANSTFVQEPLKGEICEVELVRRGRSLYAQLVHFADGTPTRTQYTEKSHDWNETSQMVPDAEDDRAKVGIICNLQVPQTWLERVRESSDHYARQAGLWDSTGDRQGPETEGTSYEDDYEEWIEDKDIVVAEERRTIRYLTQSNLKSRYYLVTSKSGSRNLHSTSGSLGTGGWHNNGAERAWALTIVDGPGRGACEQVTACNNEEGGCWFTIGDALQSTYDEIISGKSFFHVLPSFDLKNGGAHRANVIDAETHPLGVIARQHNEDRIIINGVWAYDDESDKSLEWVLKDIAAKAGVQDFDTNKSIDLTVTPPSSSQPLWLTDINGADVSQRDFDLTITLLEAAGSGDSFVLIARASSKLAAAPDDGNLTDFSAVKITYAYDGSVWTVSLHQTGIAGSNEDDWVKVDEYDIGSASGKRLRIVGRENFFSIYVNDYRLRTFHAGPIYGYDTDGYCNAIDGPGFIGIWRTGSTADWTDTEIEQPELWAWTDAVILDQRMNAVAGLQRVIRDRRVKFFGTASGALRISTFDSRDELPTIGNLLYSDGSSPTDRIPTHIRVVGAEISEYIDHDAAADYGLTFALAQAESLEEEEAYIEAQRIVDDAVSQAFARRQTAAAQLDWETEDQVPVSYVPFDGGPTVDDDYIVDSVRLSFRPGDMTMQATVRKAP